MMFILDENGCTFDVSFHSASESKHLSASDVAVDEYWSVFHHMVLCLRGDN